MYGRFERKNKTPGQRAYQSSQPKSQQLAQPKTPPLSGTPVKQSPKAPPVASVPPQNVPPAAPPQMQQQAMAAPKKMYPGMGPKPPSGMPKAPMRRGPSPQQMGAMKAALAPAAGPMGAGAVPTGPSPMKMSPQQQALMGMPSAPGMQRPEAPPSIPQRVPYMGSSMFMSQQPGEPSVEEVMQALGKFAAAQQPSTAGQRGGGFDMARDPRGPMPVRDADALYEGGGVGSMTPEQISAAMKAILGPGFAGDPGVEGPGFAGVERGFAGLTPEEAAAAMQEQAAINALLGMGMSGVTGQPGRNDRPFEVTADDITKMLSAVDLGYTSKPEQDSFGFNLKGETVDETGKPAKMTPMEATYYGQEDKIKNLAGFNIYDLLDDETPGIFSPEELAAQALEIDKATQAAQAAMSQQMGARGFGASGVAGANLGNIAAAGEAAKTQLMVDDRVAGIEANLNKLAQVSNLFGHMLSEEQRMEIAQMQEDLEREKFEYTKTEGKEADQWNMLNSSLALLGGEKYTPTSASQALGMLKAGYSPEEVLGAMDVSGDQVVFNVSGLPEGSPLAQDSDDPDIRQSQFAMAQDVGFKDPPPGYVGNWPSYEAQADPNIAFDREGVWEEYLSGDPSWKKTPEQKQSEYDAAMDGGFPTFPNGDPMPAEWPYEWRKSAWDDYLAGV